MIKRNELIEAVDSATVEILGINELIFNKNSYSRTGGIDRNAVEDYSRNILSMPPIVINQENRIVDGVHRYKASLKADQQSMKIKRIELANEDIKLANLLIDIHSGVRHPIDDKKSIVIDLYDPQNAQQNELLMDELDIPQSTFYEWTSQKRSLMKKQVNQAMAVDLLNPELTQQEIADMYGYTTRTIRSYKSMLEEKIPEIGKISGDELIEADLDFLIDYKEFVESDLQLYNIWNKSKGDNNSHFGHFPLVFMKNLLYYHTKPFELVYDPFAGSGTTIDACREMYCQCIVSDRKPDKSRPEIFKHDITEGLPDIPKPDLCFLDPPYWILANKEYSGDDNDLGNMTKEQFFDAMDQLANELNNRKVKRIAYVIRPIWETGIENGWYWVDPMFELYETIRDDYRIEARYVLPYSSQQYTGLWVDRAKKAKNCLILNRELIVLIRRE